VARQLLAEFELDAPVRLLGIGVGGLVAVADEQPSTVEATPTPAQEPLTLDL
jgi:hypothetical protein